jgi:hypothetical protein
MKDNTREEKMILQKGLNLSGVGQLYRGFEAYIGLPEFGEESDKYTDYQITTLKGFSYKTESPAQAETDIKSAIELLQEWGFGNSFDGYKKFLVEWAKEKEKKKETTKLMDKFIFDESKVIKKAHFPFPEFNKIKCFGVFLPKEYEINDKNGKFLRYKQKSSPVLIGSDRKIYEISEQFEEKYLVSINEIPNGDVYPKRWGLNSIKRFLEDKDYVVNPEDILKKIKKIYEDNIYFTNKNWYSIHALWDMGTYFYSLFKYYPLLELRGLKRTGKTKIMTTSRQFTFNATEEMTNPSEATLFRLTHEQRPTKYIDEAEKLYTTIRGKAEPDARAELINSGYKYTGNVPRQEKQGNKFATIYYKTYSPTMIGSINGLYGATEDRAIIHVTVKPTKNDKRGEKELSENNPLLPEIRNELYVFALQNWKEILKTYDEFNTKFETELSDRDFWLWKPILTLAYFIDDKLFDEILEFAEKLTNIKIIDNFTEGSTEYEILRFTYDLLKLGHSPIYLSSISEKWNNEFKPNNKTIATHLDRMGFMEFKTRMRDGTAYNIHKEYFEIILSTICPKMLDSSSLPSLASQNEENKTELVVEEINMCEANVKQREDECEANVGNVRNEAKTKLEQ